MCRNNFALLLHCSAENAAFMAGEILFLRFFEYFLLHQ